MSKLSKILELYPDIEFLKADGLDAAIIGIEPVHFRLVYSVSKIMKILQKDMTYEEAVEYFDFNIVRSYMGEKTPIYVDTEF